MRLEILQVPGCRGADLLDARLAELGHPRVIQRVITSQAEAEELGMTGSPTLLVDGADLFARPGQPPSISCRLYRDEHGRQSPAPSPGQLRAALRR
jgi:hypothetical protein